MPRLFIAIDLPAALKESLAGLTRELPAARWVGRGEIHLTLRFIGEVEEERGAAIKSALASLGFASFPLTMQGVGHFPPAGRPRVLWVGLERCDPLMQLQREIELALLDAGIPPDQRPFSPHLTLARLKDTPWDAVAKFEARHAGLCLPPFPVGEFILYSSILSRQGALHSKEAVYPSQAASAPHSP